MEMRRRTKRRIRRAICYILVAVISSAATFLLAQDERIIYNVVSNGTASTAKTAEEQKLTELAQILDTYFIGEVSDSETAEQMAAAMVEALGDRWSYYMNADEYGAYVEQMNNSYVGIGVTISTEEDNLFEVLKVEEGSGAEEAGIQAGDIIVSVEGKTVEELGLNKAKAMIKGEENSQVSLTFLRGEEEKTVSVIRKVVLVEVATAQMLENNIGLVTIANFDERCADDTIKAVEELVEQGAKALIFDVRFNPGGYKNELVDVLDYLLPEGDLFRSVNYKGQETIDPSDEECLDLPMAVLVNANSFSAAEFFAAALNEYDWAVTVGEATTGKSYFQTTFELSDGSAVNLSVGKYYTPKGVSLVEVGGLVPEIEVEVDEKTAAKIYAGSLDPEEDPQIQAAVTALLEEIG